MSKERRVVVTGLGVISPAGINVNEFWNNLVNGANKVNLLTEFNLPSRYFVYGAKIKNLKSKFKKSPYKSYLDKAMHFGLLAAEEAYLNSGINNNRCDIPLGKFGLFIGSTTGGIDSVFHIAKDYFINTPLNVLKEFIYAVLSRGKPIPVHKTALIAKLRRDCSATNIIWKFSPGYWAAILAHYFAIDGPVMSYCTSCYSGGEAFGKAFEYIQEGIIDVALTGGLDAPIVLNNCLSFVLIGAASNWKGNPAESCRPFSLDRCGMVFGEGAGFFVLESLEHARKRKTKIYAEVLGYCATSDGNSMIAPEASAKRQTKAIGEAIVQAKINVSDIDYICCHGTGTVANDRAETLAIKNALGDHAYKIVANSIKSMIGHGFGAATAIEILSTIKVLNHKLVPPTINFGQRDPECDLNYAFNSPVQLSRCNYALKTASGFGGTNLALVLKDWKE